MRTRKEIKELFSTVINETINQKLREQIHIEILLDIRDLLSEKINITKLQQRLDEKEKVINEVLITRKHSKLIYYTGLFAGIVMFATGFFSDSIVSEIAGFGISIVAIVGIYEAKKNKW